MRIQSTGLSVKFASAPILSDLTFQIAEGDFVGIIGPNGSGKTTLLRAIAGLLEPSGGVIQVDGKPLASYKPHELAALIGVVPQKSGSDFAFTVTELVAMGCYAAYKTNPLRMKDQPLTERIEWAMAEMNLLALADREVTSLSGGEWQRVLIARALAQNPRALFLDEVTTHLDIRYKLGILDKIRSLNQQKGITIIAVLHELELAAEYCSRLLLLHDGAIVAYGSPAEVLSQQNLAEVFGITAIGRAGLGAHKYQLATGSAKLRRTRIHVVGGGGSAAGLLQNLAQEGYWLSLGAVNQEDADWEVGVWLGIPVAQEIPFAALSDQVRSQNRRLMQQADKIVVADLPFGPGNLGNLEDVLEMAEQGKAVFLVDDPPIAERDFTDGQAIRLWQAIKNAGAAVVGSESELFHRINEGE